MRPICLPYIFATLATGTFHRRIYRPIANQVWLQGDSPIISLTIIQKKGHQLRGVVYHPLHYTALYKGWRNISDEEYQTIVDLLFVLVQTFRIPTIRFFTPNRAPFEQWLLGTRERDAIPINFIRQPWNAFVQSSFLNYHTSVSKSG